MSDFEKPVAPFKEWVERLRNHWNKTRQPGTPKKDTKAFLALSLNSDPFWAGTPKNTKRAKWFAGVWRNVAKGLLKHLRGGHYQWVSLPGKNAEGKTYENTEKDWERFQQASRQARHLQLVDPLSVDDMQNPPPVLPGWVDIPASGPPDVDTPDAPEFTLPAISLVSGFAHFGAFPDVAGFLPNDQHDRSHLLSIWIEKSTMNHILLPLCEEFGAELVQLTGRSSITAPVQFLKRAQKCGKPGRAFYISDFDPTGERMPVEVSRSLEFYRPIVAPDVHVALTQIALTKAQVKHFDLPKIPTKETDKSAKDFERRHGVGQTELDALEALHAGELERMIRAALRPYTDRTLSGRLREARDLALAEVQDAWRDATAEEQNELADTRRAVDAITRKYQARVKALDKAMQRDLRPHAKKLKRLEERFADIIDDFTVALPERPTPNVAPDESDWLFDSDRSYLEQIGFYKRHFGAPDDYTARSR